MNGRHGTIVVVAMLSFELGGVAHLRAAEGPAALDCGKDRSALAVTICGDEAAIAAERRTTASYLAAYYALPESRRPSFRIDHTQWLNGVTNRCRRPSDLRPGDQSTLSAECVRRLYTQRGEAYRKKLSGLALDEINLSPVLLKKIQTRLIELQFLSGNADGAFGANTRAAIRNYQASIDHVQSDFLSAEERTMLLDPPAMQAQAWQPTQATSDAISPVEASSAQQPDSPSLQSTDNRPFRPGATEHAVEQTLRLSAADAAGPADNIEIATPVARGSRLKARYLIEGGTITGVVLFLAVDAIIVRLRRRIELRRKNADDDLSGAALKRDMARPKPSMQGTGSNLDSAGHTTTAPA
jgi:Putative peptidoglycan binding domain